MSWTYDDRARAGDRLDGDGDGDRLLFVVAHEEDVDNAAPWCIAAADQHGAGSFRVVSLGAGVDPVLVAAVDIVVACWSPAGLKQGIALLKRGDAKPVWAPAGWSAAWPFAPWERGVTDGDRVKLEMIRPGLDEVGWRDLETGPGEVPPTAWAAEMYGTDAEDLYTSPWRWAEAVLARQRKPDLLNCPKVVWRWEPYPLQVESTENFVDWIVDTYRYSRFDRLTEHAFQELNFDGLNDRLRIALAGVLQGWAEEQIRVYRNVTRVRLDGAFWRLAEAEVAH